MAMTPEALRAICKEHKLYYTPELNDTIYCGSRGFTSLTGLEKYTGLRALFLEGNALGCLAPLPPLPELQCLYLQANVLTSLQGLSSVAPHLHVLNLGGNALTSLRGLAPCAQLQTLLAADNQLASSDAIGELAGLGSLETLDLQGNELRDSGALLRLLRRLPALTCLYLKGNPVVGSCQDLRKRVVAALPRLSYLDDTPVGAEERRCAEAWARGGVEAELAERERCAAERRERAGREFEGMQKIRAAAFRRRREALGLPAGDTDPFMDMLGAGEELDDDASGATASEHGPPGHGAPDPAT